LRCASWWRGEGGGEGGGELDGGMVCLGVEESIGRGQ